MKFFIDTANVDDIRKAADMGVISPSFAVKKIR